MQTVFNVRTSGPGLHEFTAEVVRFGPAQKRGRLAGRKSADV